METILQRLTDLDDVSGAILIGKDGLIGALHHVIIEMQNGIIQFEEVGDLILIVIAQNVSNLGRIRIEMKKACRQIVQLVASY